MLSTGLRLAAPVTFAGAVLACAGVANAAVTKNVPIGGTLAVPNAPAGRRRR